MKKKLSAMSQSFPGCSAALGKESRELFAEIVMAHQSYEGLLAKVKVLSQDGRLPQWMPDLLGLEHACCLVFTDDSLLPDALDDWVINPTLQLLPVKWVGLDRLLADSQWNCQYVEAGEIIMVWRQPKGSKIEVSYASASDLLALKLLANDLSASAVALEGGVAVGVVDAAIDQAAARGIALKPPSSIRRSATFSQDLDSGIDPSFLVCDVFAVQWHITQTCDLHCKHCYDRTSRGEMSLNKGIAILDDIRAFCRERGVHGQVTFSGGNPLMYPHFMELYQAAVDRYLGVAILGNPVPRHTIEEVTILAKPLFYQVSLEGLEAHNDYIRGRGHFRRVMDFLPILKELGIYSMVMLTLTRDNQDQVLPLAEILRDSVDLFTFNRLAQVGEGAKLLGPNQDGYRDFLADFQQAAQHNPCMGLKDNLLNLLAAERGESLFGGCAGHGCGAAFNFVSILSDGEVHACRKFPSPIGNVFTDKLSTIYDSVKAKGYRSGSAECSGCRIHPVCGGCLAVAHGLGLDPLQVRDPYCWKTGAGKVE